MKSIPDVEVTKKERASLSPGVLNRMSPLAAAAGIAIDQPCAIPAYRTSLTCKIAGLEARNSSMLSSSLISSRDGPLVRIQVNVPGTPDSNSLHEDALILPPLHIADHVDP